MELFAVSGLAGGLVSLIFGGFIFLRDPQSFRSRIFVLLAFATALWSVSYWQWLSNSSNAQDALFWVGLLSVGAIMMSALLYHWTMLTTKANSYYWRFSIYILYIVSILVAMTAWTPLLVDGVEPKLIFSYWPTAGPLYLPQILLLFVLPAVTSMARVTYRYFTSKSKTERGGMVYIFMGFILFGIGTASNFFLWFDIPVLPYGNFLVILFPILFGYSMIQYKIFTVRSVATEMLLLLLNVFVFVRMLLADTPIQLLVEFIFFVSIAIASYMLLRGVYNEISIRKDLKYTVSKVKKLNKKLKEMDEKKNEFLHIATHQLRGPITSIQGYTSLIKDGDYGKVTDKIKEPLKKILSASDVMSDTIEDYMSIARIEEGNMTQELSDFDLCRLVKERASSLMATAKDKGLKMTIELPDEDICKVHADKHNLTQVINALLENAIKYTKQGTVTVSAEVVDSADMTNKGKIVRVSIADSGIGIPKDEISSMFEKFSRASNAKSADVSGTGMGLFIVKSLMEANGGRVSINSKGINKGTTFTIELPRVE